MTLIFLVVTSIVRVMILVRKKMTSVVRVTGSTYGTIQAKF